MKIRSLRVLDSVKETERLEDSSVDGRMASICQNTDHWLTFVSALTISAVSVILS